MIILHITYFTDLHCVKSVSLLLDYKLNDSKKSLAYGCKLKHHERGSYFLFSSSLPMTSRMLLELFFSITVKALTM